MITSIALALIFVSLTENTFGANSRRFPPGVAPSGELQVGALGIDRLELIILALTIVLMLVLGYVIRSTRAGRAIRAVAENPRAAFLMGINVDRTIALTLVISPALGGLASFLDGLSQPDFSPYMRRDQAALKGLAVIVVGGMGSKKGRSISTNLSAMVRL